MSLPILQRFTDHRINRWRRSLSLEERTRLITIVPTFCPRVRVHVALRDECGADLPISSVADALAVFVTSGAVPLIGNMERFRAAGERFPEQWWVTATCYVLSEEQLTVALKEARLLVGNAFALEAC